MNTVDPQKITQYAEAFGRDPVIIKALFQECRTEEDVLARLQTNDETSEWKSAKKAPVKRLQRNNNQERRPRNNDKPKRQEGNNDKPKEENKEKPKEEPVRRNYLVHKAKVHIESDIIPTAWGNLKTSEDGQIIEVVKKVGAEEVKVLEKKEEPMPVEPVVQKPQEAPQPRNQNKGKKNNQQRQEANKQRQEANKQRQEANKQRQEPANPKETPAPTPAPQPVPVPEPVKPVAEAPQRPKQQDKYAVYYAPGYGPQISQEPAPQPIEEPKMPAPKPVEETHSFASVLGNTEPAMPQNKYIPPQQATHGVQTEQPKLSFPSTPKQKSTETILKFPRCMEKVTFDIMKFGTFAGPVPEEKKPVEQPKAQQQEKKKAKREPKEKKAQQQQQQQQIFQQPQVQPNEENMMPQIQQQAFQQAYQAQMQEFFMFLQYKKYLEQMPNQQFPNPMSPGMVFPQNMFGTNFNPQ